MVAIVPRYFWPRGSSWVTHSTVNTKTSVIIRENLYYTRATTCYRKIRISMRQGQITCGWILWNYKLEINTITIIWFQDIDFEKNLRWYYFSLIFKCKFQFNQSKTLKIFSFFKILTYLVYSRQKRFRHTQEIPRFRPLTGRTLTHIRSLLRWTSHELQFLPLAQYTLSFFRWQTNRIYLLSDPCNRGFPLQKLLSDIRPTLDEKMTITKLSTIS